MRRMPRQRPWWQERKRSDLRAEKVDLGQERRRSDTAVQRQAKRAEVLAWTIERDILSGGWEVGSHFGDEAELIERYSVSRAVLREAVQLVQRHQIARSQRGRGGGLVVTAPAEASVARAISLYLEVVGISLGELVDTRTVLELIAIRQAVGRLDEDAIRRLRDVVDAEDEVGICAAPDGLHQVVIEIAANPVVKIYVDALVSIIRQQPAVRRAAGTDRARQRPQLPRIHREIADAVVSGDTATAERAMVSHLGEVLRLDRVRGGGATANSATGHWPLGAAAPARSAEEASEGQFGYSGLGRASDTVHQSIVAEARVLGGAPGTFLGSETDLMRRHGASRAALREAVRLLEHVGVAEMRRGTSGGLVLTKAAPNGIGRSIAMYLEHCGASLDDLREVRLELELQCARLIGENMTDDIRSRLEAVLRKERRAGARLIEPRDEGPYRLSLASQFHFLLADVCGNRATQVLARPVIALTGGGHAPHHLQPEEIDRRTAAVRSAHRGIVEALLAGDLDVAMHRIRRHLAAVSVREG